MIEMPVILTATLPLLLKCDPLGPTRRANLAGCRFAARLVGKPESAGINRHVVGDERALQERRAANPSWPRVLQATPRGVA
jgi:hypothetical protein